MTDIMGLNERLIEIEDALISTHDEIAELESHIDRLNDEYTNIETELMEMGT
jgi:predicted  nucleic acid-binding Zn-ribbon protein